MSVKIQLVTVRGCPEASCATCDLAEAVLRQAIGLAGIPLPPHTGHGEYHFDDGRTIEAVHLECDQAENAELDPEEAPFLLINDQLVLQGEFDPDKLAEAVLKALFPHGLADLRR